MKRAGSLPPRSMLEPSQIENGKEANHELVFFRYTIWVENYYLFLHLLGEDINSICLHRTKPTMS